MGLTKDLSKNTTVIPVIAKAITLPTIKPRSADAALIFNAMRNRRTPITICMLDEEDGEGFIGDFELFGGSNSQEDDDVQNWEITARPAASGKPPKWIDATTT